MKRKEFLIKATLDTIISAGLTLLPSCSSLPFLKKQQEVICLNQEFFENDEIRSDNVGNYYPHKLSSGKNVAFRINHNEKYKLGDCFSIIPDKKLPPYKYEDQKLPIYMIKEKIN